MYIYIYIEREIYVLDTIALDTIVSIQRFRKMSSFQASPGKEKVDMKDRLQAPSTRLFLPGIRRGINPVAIMEVMVIVEAVSEVVACTCASTASTQGFPLAARKADSGSFYTS